MTAAAPPARRPKVGLVLPLFSGDTLRVVAFARRAEDLGFDGVFAFDHFFPPGAPGRPSLEAFTTLAAVAAATSRVRVGTLVARAVLRPAGMLAKLAASLDVISGGRMILGIGTGDWIDQPEHERFGFPDQALRERRVHLAEVVAAVKALLAGGRYEGGQSVPGLSGPVLPRPVQPGGPPVWLGAQADDVVRMAGRLADGWNGWGLEPPAFARKVKLLYDAAETERPSRTVEASWAGIALLGNDEAEAERLLEVRRGKGLEEPAFTGAPDRFAAHLRALADAGAAWTVVVAAGPGDRVELLAERVLPALDPRG